MIMFPFVRTTLYGSKHYQGNWLKFKIARGARVFYDLPSVPGYEGLAAFFLVLAPHLLSRPTKASSLAS